jgi:16S rRNA pseudouridine516 synthase
MAWVDTEFFAEFSMDNVRPVQRIDKLLANLGYCSRREAAEYIRKHDVTVEGRRILDGSGKADPHKVLIDNTLLDHPDGLLLLCNKPAGFICSHDASEGRLIYELLPKQWMHRNPVPTTIGRLDKDTTGVILITDLPMINHALSSPRKKIDKIYEVALDKSLSPDLITLFSSGLILTGEAMPCLPATLRIQSEFCAEVTLHEGRYHQIKRMFQQCGYTVIKLHRSRFGPYDDGIAEGTYIHLPITHG